MQVNTQQKYMRVNTQQEYLHLPNVVNTCGHKVRQHNGKCELYIQGGRAVFKEQELNLSLNLTSATTHKHSINQIKYNSGHIVIYLQYPNIQSTSIEHSR